MIAKWICIPYGIIVVIMAGYVQFVVPEYLSSYSVWYSSYERYSILEYALAFGIFGGIITGFVVDLLSQRVSFILAAILAITSYGLIPEFDGSSKSKQEDWHFYLLAVLVFIVGQSSSLAIISTIKINLQNFSITAAPIILSILLSYFYICEHFESTIHWNFFSGLDTRVYMYGVGITASVIYVMAAIILSVDEGQQMRGGVSEYQLATLDKVGLSVFIIYELFMVLLLLLFKLVIKDVFASTWIGVLLLAGNFVIPILSAKLILNKASDLLSGFAPDVNDLNKLQKGKDKEIFASLKSGKLITLFLVSVIMIGVGDQIYERLSKISNAISMGYLAEYSMIWYIFGNFVTRSLIGTSFVLLNCVNDFVYMVLFAIEMFIALLLVLLTPNHSIIVFNIAGFLGGSGVGGFWIMTPLIIAQDFGKKHFGLIWGTFTTGIQAGILVFCSYIFDHFYNKYHKDRWGRCTQPEGFKSSFIVSDVIALFGLILIILLWYMDKKDTEEGRDERNKLEQSVKISEA